MSAAATIRETYESFGGRASGKEIATLLGLNPDYVRKALSRMRLGHEWHRQRAPFKPISRKKTAPDIVVRRVPVLGGYSTAEPTHAFVSLPRVVFIDGAAR